LPVGRHNNLRRLPGSRWSFRQHRPVQL